MLVKKIRKSPGNKSLEDLLLLRAQPLFVPASYKFKHFLFYTIHSDLVYLPPRIEMGFYHVLLVTIFRYFGKGKAEPESHLTTNI